MNLPPPPKTKDIDEINVWLAKLYQYLQYPAMHQLRMVPRTSEGTTQEEGHLYWDEDEHALKTYDGTDVKTFSFD